MLAKMALRGLDRAQPVGTGMTRSAGKPVWLKPNERAQLALQGGACTSPMPGSGRSGNGSQPGGHRSVAEVEPHAWKDPGQAASASGGTVPTAGQRAVKGLTGVGETLIAGGMRPGVPALVYHEGVPLTAEMHEGAPKQRPQAAGSGHGAAPPKPAAGEAKAAVVQRGIEESQGRAPKAEHRQEPTPAQRAEAWTQIDEIQAAWQALGVPLPEDGP
jgi:hypothetical protein